LRYDESTKNQKNQGGILMAKTEYKTYNDFVYDIKDGKAHIAKYTGESEEVIVPGYIEGLPVADISARIGDGGCFCQCPQLKRVLFSEGIEKIGFYAFSRCEALESLVFPASLQELDSHAIDRCPALIRLTVAEDNQKYADLDGVLTNKEKTEIVFYPHGRSGRYDIPAGVTAIGSHAFAESFLESLSIPASVKEINYGAFSGCRYLTEVMLPEGIEEIVFNAFENCTVLTSIKIPASVTKIDSSAFEGCAALARINIPAGVTQIRYDAFKGCASLSEIVIPEGVKAIEHGTFVDCAALKKITIPASVTKISVRALAGCQALESIMVAENNPVYASLEGALYDKEKNSFIFMPLVQRSRKAESITGAAELAGMTDQEIVLKIGAELGYGCKIQADDGWTCCYSMFDFMHSNYLGLHEKLQAFYEGERITKLSLCGLDVKKLPLAIAALSALKVLDVSHTTVEELPEWVGELGALEVLNIYGTKISVLPESLGNCTALKELHLGHNKIASLPASLGKLVNLEWLCLNHTAVSELPECIGNCRALQEINLHGSRIEHLPASFGQLTELKYMYTYFMPLQELPADIGNLTKLISLCIAQTPISELPESIVKLTALKSFNFKYSKIKKKDVPKELRDIIAANKKADKATDEVCDDDDDDDDWDGSEPRLFISIGVRKLK
jgi:hypothetical protein